MLLLFRLRSLLNLRSGSGLVQYRIGGLRAIGNRPYMCNGCSAFWRAFALGCAGAGGIIYPAIFCWMMPPAFCPPAQGLYRPSAEHDACGVGFVAHLENVPSHETIRRGVQILENLTHRGAVGANPTTGDGAGMLLQLPDALLRAEMPDLPADPADSGGEHAYAVGMLFLPQDPQTRAAVEAIITTTLAAEGMAVCGWREVPTNADAINSEVAASAPVTKQVFVLPQNIALGEAFERQLYIARKLIERAVAADSTVNITADPAGFYCASLSSRTIVYKGMFLADQLAAYYPDLRDERFASALAVVHQRFSTNTFPAWRLAHPYRLIAHNGEINTLRGNINNMLARHHSLRSPRFGEDLEKLWPLMAHGQSDTATLDNAVELLRLAGYSLAQTMAMLVPEAWQNNEHMPTPLRDFYRYHAPMMEAWDGPAEVVASDGRQIAAVLDRNGLRPGRYWLTDDGWIIMASEAGVLEVDDARITRKWRIQPGKILLVDLDKKRLVSDDEVKQTLAAKHPYGDWADRSQQTIADSESDAAAPIAPPDAQTLLRCQQRFGYTQEDLKFILAPMCADAAEPVGSMGDDTPLAAISEQMKPLTWYFRQEFAQVTNPAIDPIREELVMSLNSYVGARPNLLALGDAPQTRCLALSHPILTTQQFDAIAAGKYARPVEIDITYNESDTLDATLTRLREQAQEAVASGGEILILSDRATNNTRIAVPMLLAASSIHQHLVARGDRTSIGLVVDTGAARSVHDMAVLIGYGVEAIHPYLAYQTVQAIDAVDGAASADAPTAAERVARYRKALGKGLLKVMSKMGIATVQSYCGAQIFEAVGLSQDLIDAHFCGTVSQIGGLGVAELETEARFWHGVACNNPPHPLYANALAAGGDFAFRVGGEAHLWSPQSVAALQHAVRGNNAQKYSEYAQLINTQSERLMTLRGMLDIQTAGEGKNNGESVDISQVEPAADIVRRFSTGAMSFGSLSYEAHSTLAVAMNRIGGKSNTGEGGEEAERYIRRANGDTARSAIKQVASGRFGVTAEYLANSDMMQIKIAQGAKPGEGGQLPGHKVDREIARVRHSVAGVGLISPPPHHDIYSIEDIAQLIYDLKCANPSGQVSVKLVSRVGVGTVAAGVAKAKSDHITISGYDGGTGASPLSSIKHAGTPWELGLSETHQTLVLNDLRGRVALQVDGQIKTGRDVVVGALLGADEFGFATAPLVAQGCIMMRKCHLNTCPVGVATQDPRLRRKFAGTPEHVVNYFFFVAEEIRALLAKMGFTRLDDIIGRVDLLQPRTPAHWKAKTINLAPLLHAPAAPAHYRRRHSQTQDHDLPRHAIDYRWMAQADAAITGQQKVVITDRICNTDRTAGAVLSHAIAKRYGQRGLPDGLLEIRLHGVAGQSFGAFASTGMAMHLTGEANDYFGKGLSGGVLSVMPPTSTRDDANNIIIGNTALYGATSGAAYCRGLAGERFAVRNSGVRAVVEGCGDHGCEYMTGGIVVVLGAVGRNFAAGMSGGVAYVLDEDGRFATFCNAAMVDIRALEANPVHTTCSDAELLRDLLTAHARYTTSPKARTILAQWTRYAPRFVKVLPYEYERALTARTPEQAKQTA